MPTLTGQSDVDETTNMTGVLTGEPQTNAAAQPGDRPVFDADGNEIDLQGHINTLLDTIQSTGMDRAARLQDLFMQYGADVDPGALTEGEKQALETIRGDIARTADRDREQAVAILTHRGLGRSTDIAERFGHFAEKKLIGMAQAEAGFVTNVMAQKREQQTNLFSLAAGLQSQITSGNLEYARTLLDAYNASANVSLGRDQLELQRDIFEENASLNRDKFTEDQLQNMRDAGFTDRQIKVAEQGLAFESEMRQREFTASNDLAQKNFGLQQKVQLGQLDLAQQAQTLAELKNNHDMILETRAQQLAEKVQLTTLDIETDKFELYARQLEREYGLDVNRFELARFIETGRLSAEILNSQRAYDLQDEKQKNEFFISKTSLALQEKLGWRELDIKYALGRAQISVEEEANRITDWANRQNIKLERDRLNAQIKQERDRRRGGLLGGLLGAAVKLGIGLLNPTAGLASLFLETIQGASRNEGGLGSGYE